VKSEWITHKGVRLIYCNFQGFSTDVEGLQKEVEAVDREICRQLEGSVLALADLQGTVASKKVVELFKLSAARTRNHVRKQAVVGVTGIRRLLAEAVARFSGQSMMLFDTVEEAKDWLAIDQNRSGTPVSPSEII
jgi:hypothetical protein